MNFITIPNFIKSSNKIEQRADYHKIIQIHKNIDDIIPYIFNKVGLRQSSNNFH